MKNKKTEKQYRQRKEQLTFKSVYVLLPMLVQLDADHLETSLLNSDADINAAQIIQYNKKKNKKKKNKNKL